MTITPAKAAQPPAHDHETTVDPYEAPTPELLLRYNLDELPAYSSDDPDGFRKWSNGTERRAKITGARLGGLELTPDQLRELYGPDGYEELRSQMEEQR